MVNLLELKTSIEEGKKVYLKNAQVENINYTKSTDKTAYLKLKNQDFYQFIYIRSLKIK